VPLCFHKCHYCDFYSVEHDAATQPDRQQALVDALLREIEAAAAEVDLRPTTIFVGGGTPTILAPHHWRRMLAELARSRVLDRTVEFTVEANPETVTAELAVVLAEGGVNRVSIGAQSFNPAHLKTLERWHDPRNVARAMDHFRAAGITNINLDLIFGVPGQTPAEVDADLRAALDLAPTHLSYYGLTYEPNTAMTQRLRMGQVQRIDEDAEREMYALILDRMADAGFEQYEISAWARAGTLPDGSDLRCRHNLLYWTCGDYLGLGPGAASHIDGRRWKIAPRLGDYIAASPDAPVVDHELLDPAQRTTERLMMNLRLREGVPLDWFTAAVSDRAGVEHLAALGLIERTATHLRLTRQGLFVADAVIAELA
jgi:oxygen-independent coproporphyrinogen-3 oxidase